MTSPAREEIVGVLSGALQRASNGRAKLERLDDDARIIEDIGLSSLDVLDLRCEVEERWNMKLADEELAEMQTVGDIVRMIVKRASITHE